MSMKSPSAKAEEFLKISSQFMLGELVTETPHPDTIKLSEQAQDDLPGALEVLKDVDLSMLKILREKLPQVEAMSKEIHDTLRTGGRVFLSGCGSTGRLALAVETIWRSSVEDEALRERVVGFMAGGDLALIKAVEEFEDYTEYGGRQLEELGFSQNDLLLAITEGGETPFVIGTAWKAAELSVRRPYFLYCNPDDLLRKSVERSREIVDSEKIRKINLTVGPMAISGSTRMQATTVQMLAAGMALLHDSPEAMRYSFERLYDYYSLFEVGRLVPFTIEESRIYLEGGYLFYEASEASAITVLTDTTERAPTFSLYPFENQLDRNSERFHPSLCYLVLPDARNSEEGYRMLLGRDPRTLNWPELKGAINDERLYGHDFSARITSLRRSYLPEAVHHTFAIRDGEGRVSFELGGQRLNIDFQEIDLLCRQVILKMLLNMHSTLVMGRLGRYEGNLMTWLRSSNNKLIDRTIRYARILLSRRGIEASYEEVCRACFSEMETIRQDQPIVLHTVERVLSERNS